MAYGFPTPDQKAEHIARLLVEEVMPCFGVPEALLSDTGTNLLSFLMKDICKMLGIEKLNTTASHPQCNSAVERFNRTLKLILRKHVAKYGMQWDQYISGVVWAYCNTPHSSTGEKPSFLLFGLDCHSPTKTAFLPARTKSLRATQPWHGPYQTVSRHDPDITVTKVYFSGDPLIQVHRSRVQHCPLSFTLGFHWYRTKRTKPGRLPKQVLKQLAATAT